MQIQFAELQLRSRKFCLSLPVRPAKDLVFAKNICRQQTKLKRIIKELSFLFA
jgi:hypothetical protein